MRRAAIVLLTSAIVLQIYGPKGSHAQSSETLCSPSAHAADPCKCCKISCWHNENTLFSAQHKRFPGSGGEHEAMDVLFKIKRCIHDYCQLACINAKASRLPQSRV